MTDVGIPLKNILVDDVDVAALVADRVGPFPLPQTPTLPAITYSRVSGPRHHDIDMLYPRYQVTAWATTYVDARTLAQTIIECLQRYKGTKNGVEINQVSILNDLDLRDSDTGYYTVPVDVQIIFRED